MKIPRDDHDSAVLVLDIPGRGRIPCLSPTSILDSRTINQYRKSSKEKGKDDGRKALFRRSTKIFAVNSAPALRDDNVHGHLLCDGPRNFKGRVVDDQLLWSLKAGCLRVGLHSLKAYYTLDRPFYVDKTKLRDVACLLFSSAYGIQLCAAGRDDVKRLIGIGNMAINSQLIFHETIKSAIISLDNASGLEAPEIDDVMFQLSIGGDPDALMLGQFLPCKKMCGHPDITVRCACGFTVEGIKASKGLLRRMCDMKLKSE